MKLLPLVDADSIVYKAAYGCKYDLIQALDYSNFLLDRIWDRFGTPPKLFLSGTSNFRYSVDSSYKAHRVTPKPRFYQSIRDYFVSDWKAEIVDGYEADDVLGVCGTDPFSVMCSIDKDLHTCPGNHYNYIKDEFYEISKDQAAWYFWKQVLMGDSTDNVIGIKGIGEKKAVKLLEGLDVREYRGAVLDAYLNYEKKRKDHNLTDTEIEQKAFEEFDKTARLIFIKRGKLESEYYHYY